MKHTHFLEIIIAAAGLVGSSAGASTQTFPDRLVSMIVAAESASPAPW